MFEGQQLPDHMYSFNTYYGDGSEIEPDVLQHIRVASWQSAVGFRWRNGDLLAIDNMTVQHGRISFTGPRKVLAFLTSNCRCLTLPVYYLSVYQMIVVKKNAMMLSGP